MLLPLKQFDRHILTVVVLMLFVYNKLDVMFMCCLRFFDRLRAKKLVYIVGKLTKRLPDRFDSHENLLKQTCLL